MRACWLDRHNTSVTPSALRSLPPDGLSSLSPLQQALWHAAQGDWETAHGLAQEVGTAEGAWVHAYLHRREGDLANAAYWYRQARQPICTTSLPDEWDALASAIH